MTSPHPPTEKWWQTRAERRRHRFWVAVLFLYILIASVIAVWLSAIAHSDPRQPNDGYGVMNERQKSVVVKQHDAITAALTAEIRRAVEEIKASQ